MTLLLSNESQLQYCHHFTLLYFTMQQYQHPHHLSHPSCLRGTNDRLSSDRSDIITSQATLVTFCSWTLKDCQLTETHHHLHIETMIWHHRPRRGVVAVDESTHDGGLHSANYTMLTLKWIRTTLALDKSLGDLVLLWCLSVTILFEMLDSFVWILVTEVTLQDWWLWSNYRRGVYSTQELRGSHTLSVG